MRRAALRASTATAWLALCATVAFAQVPEKTLRIGILSSGTRDIRAPLDAALINGLHEQGYVEGRNLIVERRYGATTIKDSAAELARMNLDAIVTTCTPSTRTMKEATSSTPIVMAAVSDPVRQGIIASLAQPGQNVTGTSSQAEDLLAKRLEFVTRVLPRTTTVAVLVNANNPVHAIGWEKVASAAQGMNVNVVRIDLARGDDLAEVFETARRARAGALFVMPDDPLLMNLRLQLVDQAAKHNLPDFYWASEFVIPGGLMSYGESLRESYRTAASYVGRIVKGARPGALPVQQPTHFELVINLKRAQALGLEIPQSLLLQADHIVR